MSDEARIARPEPCPMPYCAPYVDRDLRCPDCTGDCDLPAGQRWGITDDPAPSGPWVLRADLDALLDPLPEPVHDYALGARNQLIVIKDALDALTHGRSEDEGEPT